MSTNTPNTIDLYLMENRSIEQGDTDNSEYGAENTVEQDYYLLTAPEEVTKE